MKPRVYPVDICVCCGAPVPEGRMVCWQCEHGREPLAALSEEQCEATSAAAPVEER